MQTHKLIRPLIVAVGLVGFSQAHGQASVLGHAGGPGDHLGWDNTNGFPLEVRHDGNQPIEWYTDALRRMLLHPTLTAQTVNGYNPVDLSGNLGIGLFNATTGSAPIIRPLTLLHLDNGGTEDAGFRDRMRTGVGMSDASEWMVVVWTAGKSPEV